MTAADGREALERFRAEPPDLVLLDLMLPHLSGVEVCRILRARVARARSSCSRPTTAEVDKVVGLELGADDYVTKPFSLRELHGSHPCAAAPPDGQAPRPRSLAPTPSIQLGDVTVDLPGHRVLRDGEPLPLKPKAFELLAFLARHPGQVFTRDQLLERCGATTTPGRRARSTSTCTGCAAVEADPPGRAPPDGPRRRLRPPPARLTPVPGLTFPADMFTRRTWRVDRASRASGAWRR